MDVSENMAVRRLHPLFAAEIKGVDLSRDIDMPTQRAIEQAMDNYAVCVLPAQQLDDDRQIAFARRYGPLENAAAVATQVKPGIVNQQIRHSEIFDVSNLDENGNIMRGDNSRWRYRQANELWHTDSSFRQKSASWSMLHGRIVPPSGGDTYFADTRAAYDALPEAMKKKLDGLVAGHSIWHSRGQPAAMCRANRSALPVRRRGIRWCGVTRVPGAWRSTSRRTLPTSLAGRRTRAGRYSAN